MSIKRRNFIIIVIALVAAVAIPFVIYSFPKSPIRNSAQTAPTPSTKPNFTKATIINQVQDDVQTEYYNISATTKAGLISQMNQLGPECQEGGRCYAYTQWSIDWISPLSNTPTRDNNRPTCANVAVTVSVKYTFPNWVNKNQAAPSLQREWDTYLIKLKSHEEHHKLIADKWAAEFLKQIQTINTQNYSSCRELEDKISAYHATGEIITSANKETDDYDTQTKHGATEGVVF